MKHLLKHLLLPLLGGLLATDHAMAAPPTADEISRDSRPRLESRAGHSVDTATGAFILDVGIASLQGGRIPLEFNLQYNSMLDSGFYAPGNEAEGARFGLGRGWHHSFEGSLHRPDQTSPPVAGAVITVRMGAYAGQFQFVAEGSPCQPMDAQNQADVLELLTKADGDLVDLWRLRRTDGTSILFESDGKLLAILDRNRMPIQFKEKTGLFFKPLARRIYTVSKGLRQLDDGSTAAIASSFLLHTAPYAYGGANVTDGGSRGAIDHLEQEGSGEGQGIYTYFGCSDIPYSFNGSAHIRRCLTRIYDPVTLTNLVNLSPAQRVHPGQIGTVDYRFTIPPTAPGHLLRITADVFVMPSLVRIALISPLGTVLPVAATKTGEPLATIMTDRFLGENLGGTWRLRVFDYFDGRSGIIKSVRVDRAVQPAAWVGYSYIADPNGNVRIEKSFDHNGVTIFRNFYDTNGRVTAQETGGVTANQGTPPRTNFRYSELPGGDLLTTVSDRTPQQNRTGYLHDRYFNLKRVTDPLDNATLHTYDPATHYRTSTTDPLLRTTSYTYTPTGQLASIIEPTNRTTSFSHDIFRVATSDGFQPDSIRNFALWKVSAEYPQELPEAGTSVVVLGHYNGVLNRLRIFDSTGARIFDRHSVELKPEKVAVFNSWIPSFDTELQPLNPRAYFVNLAADSIREDWESDNLGNVTTITDALGQTSTYKYDEFSNLKSSSNALDNFQSSTYNRDGQLTNMVNKDSVGIVTAHDTKGNTTSVGYVGNETIPAETIEYDTFGRVTKMTDSGGRWTTFTYDVRGNVISVRNTNGDGEDSGYNERDQLISRTDALGRVTRYEYDLNGNQTAVIRMFQDVVLEKTRTEYDEEDRPIRRIDAGGFATVTKYDAAGRVTSVTDPENNVKSYTYDAAGNTTATYRGGILVATFKYNEMGLLESTTNGHGHTVMKAYDAVGQETSSTEVATNRTTTSEYDSLGRLKKVTDPHHRQYHKTYLKDDVVDEIRHANDPPTRFTYTGKNNVASITTPGGKKTEFRYTHNDFISEYIPPSLVKSQQYTYNNANRLIRTHHLSPGVPDIIYGHDKVGNVLTVSTQLQGGPEEPKIIRVYDDLNRQTSFTDAAGNTTRHVYDVCGLVSRIIYPGSKTVDYRYDGAKRLKTVTDWAGRVTHYSYNAQDQITSIEFPNQTRRVFTYDHAALLTSRSDYDAMGGIIVRYLYTHDGNGKILVEAATHTPVNWTPAALTMTYGNDNQLATMNGNAITYDVDGNMTQGIVSGGVTSLQWDARNNLRQSGSTTFNYDVQDRLVGWQNGASSVSLAVIPNSQGSMVLVSTPSSGTATQYVYGIGLGYEVTGDDIKVHHYDERGNTIAFSGNAGIVTGRIAYSPHGHIIQQTGVSDSLFKFGALFGVIHAPNGLSYMRFRWYSPEMLRFLSLDSVYGDIDLPTTLNRYVYGFGDPINQVDASGEHPILFAIAVGALIGAVLAVAVEAISAEIEGRPHKWQNYLGAALGGALGGAVAAAGCSVCGGIVESLASDLFTAAFNGDAVDGVGLLQGVGGALIGAGLGKGLNKLGKKAFAQLGKGGKQITNKLTGAFLKRQSASVTKTLLTESSLAVRKIYKDIGVGAVKDLALAAPIALLGNASLPLMASPSKGEGAASVENGNAFKYIIRATVAPSANIGRGGEFLHYQRYLEALSLAGRPVPNPVMAVPSF